MLSAQVSVIFWHYCMWLRLYNFVERAYILKFIHFLVYCINGGFRQHWEMRLFITIWALYVTFLNKFREWECPLVTA